MHGFDKYDREPWELGAPRPDPLAKLFKALLVLLVLVMVFAIGHSVAHGQTNYFTDTTTPLGGAATFTGVARDIGGGAPPPYVRFGCLFATDQAGTAFIDSSVDNSTWVVAATAAIVASTPLDLDTPLRTRYVRCRETNGATPQTTNRVVSSLRG